MVGNFPSCPVVRLGLPMQGLQVWPLVFELRSYIPHGQKNQKVKQKQYCNKFNEDFKMVHIKKKNLKNIKRQIRTHNPSLPRDQLTPQTQQH